jgi:protein TonB
VAVNGSPDEPVIPSRLRRPLAAMWISLGLHAAVIALVQVAPPAATSMGERVIEARLVSTHAEPAAVETPPMTPAVETPDDVPLLGPSEAAEALPVAEPIGPRSVQPEPPAASAASQPAPASVPSGGTAPPAAATITSSVDLTYYSVRDLDVQPRALREIVPDYPYDADRQRVSGQVRVQLKLEADGRVSDIAVVGADPPGLFEDSALRAFRNARFIPAQRNGRPVRARVVITIVYDWEGRDAR